MASGASRSEESCAWCGAGLLLGDRLPAGDWIIGAAVAPSPTAARLAVYRGGALVAHGRRRVPCRRPRSRPEIMSRCDQCEGTWFAPPGASKAGFTRRLQLHVAKFISSRSQVVSHRAHLFCRRGSPDDRRQRAARRFTTILASIAAIFMRRHTMTQYSADSQFGSRIECTDDVLQVSLYGDLIYETLASLQSCWELVRGQFRPTLVLDLSAVTYLSSGAGIDPALCAGQSPAAAGCVSRPRAGRSARFCK